MENINQNSKIDVTAKVGSFTFIENSEIGPNVVVGHNCSIIGAKIEGYCHIGNNVSINGNIQIGQYNTISDGVIVSGNVRIGMHNQIESGSVIGCLTPRSGKFKGGRVYIGNNNFIAARINSSTNNTGTIIANDVILHCCIIAPNCQIGVEFEDLSPSYEDCKTAVWNGAVIDADVIIYRGANIISNVTIRPNVWIGPYAIIHDGTVTKDVLPGSVLINLEVDCLNTLAVQKAYHLNEKVMEKVIFHFMNEKKGQENSFYHLLQCDDNKYTAKEFWNLLSKFNNKCFEKSRKI